jgi:long-chain fatty acid transport protein
MKTFFRSSIPLVVAAVCALAPPASATNGYFSHGYGPHAKGMAGAGVALAMDGLSCATNPAAMAFLGRRTDFGVALFQPYRDVTVLGSPSGYPGTFGLAPGTTRSGSTNFVIPHIASNWSISPRLSFGFAAYGNGGMNTDYASPIFGAGPAGVDLAQLFVAPTLAYRPWSLHSFGLTGIGAYQRFEARGLASFGAYSSDPSKLTDNGYSSAWGGGFRVGYLGRLHRLVSVGGAYQTRLWMTQFDHYAGLFCQQGDFDVPSNWTLGLALHPDPRIDLAVDAQRVNYSEVHSVGHPLFPNILYEPLGNMGSAGFGWRDITTTKLGAQVRTGRGWTVRGGYSYGDQPIPESEVLLNILAPAVIERHASFGLSKVSAPGREVTLAVTRAFSTTISGPNPLEAPGQQRIELRMDQWEFEVGFGFWR